MDDFRVLMAESFFRVMEGLATEAFGEVVEEIRATRNLDTLTA